MIVVREPNGSEFLEAAEAEALVSRADDFGRVIEQCLSTRVRSVLLYPANLPPAFFDLSSGEAGDILEKARRMRIRFCVVCPPGTVKLSSRFHELVADEFRVFESRDAACDWLR
jgi:Domain of unknown function (DUF4180)